MIQPAGAADCLIASRKDEMWRTGGGPGLRGGLASRPVPGLGAGCAPPSNNWVFRSPGGGAREALEGVLEPVRFSFCGSLSLGQRDEGAFSHLLAWACAALSLQPETRVQVQPSI